MAVGIVGGVQGCGTDFENCKSTRTCAPEADDGGAGGDGASSSGAAAGEGSNVSGSSSGAGETSGIGGEPAGAFDIVATTPEVDAVGIERDAVIELKFSLDVDAESITSVAVKVVGPSGEVPGKLAVAGATVTFTPGAPLALLADYRVSIAPSAAASDGTLLGVARQFDFQSRDGVFRKPQRLTSENVVGLSLRGTRSGYAAVWWEDGKTPASPDVAMFDPATAAWGKVLPLEADAVKDYSSTEVCLNERGDAFASMGGIGHGAWTRWEGGSWAPASSVGVAQRRSCAMGEDGTVMTLWSDTISNASVALAASLSVSNTWSAQKTLQTKATGYDVQTYKDGFLVLHTREPNGDVFSQVFDSVLGWSTAVAVTPPNVGANYTSLSTFQSSGLFVWGDTQGRAQGSLFDGETWTTADLGPATYGKTTSASSAGYLTAWVYQGVAYAVRYDSAGGWLDPVKLGSTTAEDWGPGSALDDAGNALAIFPTSSSVMWKRASHTTLEWLDGDAIENQDPKSLFATAAATGEVIVVWQNQLGVWASRFE